MARITPRHLFRLYPGPWRARYGDEFVALLEQEGTGPRVVLSVMAGAFDAWISPTGPIEMEMREPFGPSVLSSKVDHKAGKYQKEWWLTLLGAMIVGLIVHGIGQLVHPGRMFPISFMAGFLSAFQLWVFRPYRLRTRIAAAFWVFLFATAGLWLAHFLLHEFVYPWFGQ